MKRPRRKLRQLDWTLRDHGAPDDPFMHSNVFIEVIVEESQKLTRGSLLQRIAIAPIAIGAFAALAAEAEAKAPQNAVMYQNKPKDGKKCSACKFYINNKKNPKANGGCTQVLGSISPNGWCVVYAPGPNKGNK